MTILAILAVPTNIITGFLGAGKTSAILNLLKSKPAGERWAILLNEFGEIGVDGSIVQGQSHEDDGVYIREVPGGCMCCTSWTAYADCTDTVAAARATPPLTHRANGARPPGRGAANTVLGL